MTDISQTCSFLLAALALSSSFPLIAQQHPHMFLTHARIETLKQEIAGPRSVQWQQLSAVSTGLVQRHPPAYRGAAQGDSADQIWQRDIGNAVANLAFSCVLTDDPALCGSALEWAKASALYPTWGFDKYAGNDLAAGHQLFGLAVFYDWMYSKLEPADRAMMHDTLLARGRTMFQATDPVSGAYWKNEYLQNHLWVSMAGLTAAALAIPEEAETASWLAMARDKFRSTEAALGSDGASHEGVGYWSYGVEYLLKFWSLSADLLGEDLHSGWWRNTAMYRLYLGLPSGALTPNNTAVDIADSPRGDWYGPDYLLFNLASRFHDGAAQWLGLQLEQSGLTTPVSPFLNVLWFDPTLEPVAPAQLPTLRWFDDMGIVSSRSDWSGNESLVVFKCGAPAGETEVKLGFASDPGFGHVHPDANHFVIFGNGQWLIQDDGYAWKETAQHNTLLVDGVGQDGEDGQWFSRKTPLPANEATVLMAESNLQFDVFAGEAAPAYPPRAGLKRFTRTLIFLKPSTLLAIDEIEADRPRNLELRFHPVEGANVQVRNLTPDGVTADTGTINGKDRDNNPLPQYTVRFRKTSASWRNLTAITWPAGAANVNTALTASPERGGLRIQAAELSLHYRAGEVHRKPSVVSQ